MFNSLTIGASVASYILLAMGLHCIARRRGIHRPWLAWIPVANLWLLGCISDQYRHEALGQVKNKRKAMLTLGILTYALTAVVLVLSISMLVDVLPYLPEELADINQWQKLAVMDQPEMEDYLLSLMDETPVLPTGVEDAVVIKGLLILVLGLGVLGTAVALTVLEYMAYRDVLISSDSRNGSMYFLIGMIASFTVAGVLLLPLFVFLVRKKDMGMPPRSGQIIDAQEAWIE